MDVTLSRDTITDKLTLASRFTSNKLTSSTALQGVLLKAEKNLLHLYSTNLNAYFHTTIPLKAEAEFNVVIEPKKILEFLHFLSPGDLTISVKDKQIAFTAGKTKGAFPLMLADDFPLPPTLKEPEHKIETKFFLKNLPLVLFTASSDETRPALTGINFVNADDELLMVSTDGFRLSLIKEKKKGDIPSMIVPSDFLNEMIRNVRDVKEIGFAYSKEDKIVMFKAGDMDFYTRLIDQEFPPFERVIPAETKTKVTIDRSEFMRNVKLISVFARDFSNVVVCEFKQDGLYMRPKKEGGEENTTHQDITIEGEDQKIAFNFKFLLDLINHVDTKELNIEILRSDAPIVFKIPKEDTFLHIIMPVRVQE